MVATISRLIAGSSEMVATISRLGDRRLEMLCFIFRVGDGRSAMLCFIAGQVGPGGPPIVVMLESGQASSGSRSSRVTGSAP